MSKILKIVASTLLGLGLTLGLAACSQKVDASKATAIIDVRTPDEYASGHLQGAVNINVESPEFDSQVATMDKEGIYLLYCHSGRRASIALDRMHSLGFKNLTNLGGYQDASDATGLPIVQ